MLDPPQQNTVRSAFMNAPPAQDLDGVKDRARRLVGARLGQVARAGVLDLTEPGLGHKHARQRSYPRASVGRPDSNPGPADYESFEDRPGLSRSCLDLPGPS
jgi:hypothetical protein